MGGDATDKWEDFKKHHRNTQGYSLMDGNKIIELQAEIDRLKEENDLLRLGMDANAKAHDVMQDIKNELAEENAALKAEVEKYANRWNSSEEIIAYYKESLDDLTCLYERLWTDSFKVVKKLLLNPTTDPGTHPLETEVNSLRAQLAKANEALDWYGDEQNYFAVNYPKARRPKPAFAQTPILRDRGQRAREARK